MSILSELEYIPKAIRQFFKLGYEVPGMVHKRERAVVDGRTGYLVWDYVAYNAIYFEGDDGYEVRFFDSFLDKKAEAEWNRLIKKHGTERGNIHVQEETEKDSL